MPREVTVRCGPFQKRLKLTATQERHLGHPGPRAILSGPPGSGKSLVLMLKGLEWLQAGHDVIVFGIHVGSMPGSRLIYHQLSEAYKEAQGSLQPADRSWGQVKWEHSVLKDARVLDSTLNAVLKHGDKLHVLMDDFCPDDGFAVEMMLVFMRELRTRAGPDLHLWATIFFAKLPEAFTVLMLNDPVRYPIPVMLEVKMTLEVITAADIVPATHKYAEEGSSATQYLPHVIHLRHTGSGDRKWPLNSEKCGKQVAKVLRDIGVGTPTESGDFYEFREVMIISRCPVESRQTPPPFVRGLEASGMPTEIFGRRSEGGMIPVEESLDKFILARENKVTLMNHAAARGQDRRVVVCLTGASGPLERYQLNAQDLQELERDLQNVTQSDTHKVSKAELKNAKQAAEHELKSRMELSHRLEIWSRASHQLIVVHLPKGMEGGPSGSDNYGGGRKCVIL